METLKEKAIRLRKEGYSYTHISKNTGYSSSTLSYHLRNIPYKPNAETVRTIGKARVASAKTKASQKAHSLERAVLQARNDIGTLTKRDILMIGIGLYIGEGSKTNDIVRVVNCDYRVINFFIKWVKTFGLTNEHFVIRIHLYPDSNVEESQLFWAKKTGIPLKQFQKVCIDTRFGKDMRRVGKYPHGTAHVTVKSLGKKHFGVQLARRISALMKEVLE